MPRSDTLIGRFCVSARGKGTAGGERRGRGKAGGPGPRSVGAAQSVKSTTTGAWSDGPVPLRASRSTYASDTAEASGADA